MYLTYILLSSYLLSRINRLRFDMALSFFTLFQLEKFTAIAYDEAIVAFDTVVSGYNNPIQTLSFFHGPLRI